MREHRSWLVGWLWGATEGIREGGARGVPLAEVTSGDQGVEDRVAVALLSRWLISLGRSVDRALG